MPYRGQRLKTYLDKGAVCNVPYTTRLRRKRRAAGQHWRTSAATTRNRRIHREDDQASSSSYSFTPEATLEDTARSASQAASPEVHDTQDTDGINGIAQQTGDLQERRNTLEDPVSSPVEQRTEQASAQAEFYDHETDDYEDIFLSSDTEDEHDSLRMPNGTLTDEDAVLLSGSLSEFQGLNLPNSPTTVAEAVTMLMTFVLSHGLSWMALDDLLAIVNALSGPTAAVLPRTKYLFRKLWAAKTSAMTKTYYYCKSCGGELVYAGQSATCSCQSPGCGMVQTMTKARSDGSFFSMLDLKSQMLHLIKLNAEALHNNLMSIKEESEQSDAHVVTDITNAVHARQLRQSGRLKWHDLTITFNSDGSPVFNSSKTSMWPIQFTLNELPPQLRVKNCLVAGLWFGQQHPNMPLFLSKFVKQLEGLSVTWSCNGQTHVSHVYATCCSVDSPARAAVQNYVSFHGYFGCPWCFTRGNHDSGTMRYDSTERSEERTSQQVRHDMNLALECDCVVNGIKGPSPVIHLKNFDIVWSFSVEYMHAVLLGVTRQVTESWLDSSNSAQQYYIGTPTLVDTVDRRLLSIRPPHSFTRLPRSLKDRALWKASEWRLWLLFYSLPCTLNTLPHLYWCHFRNLVEAIFILISAKITEPHLRRADLLLQKFVSQVADYYGSHMMTYNVHILLHLANTAQHQGPLWANSAFVFEGGNGKLVKTIRAAKGAPQQVIERVVMEEEVEELLQAVPMSSTVRQICDKMMSSQHIRNAIEVDGAWLLGVPKLVQDLPRHVLDTLQNLSGVNEPVVTEYKRFTLDKSVFHSQKYTRPVKGDTTVILTHSKQFYVIRRILYIARATGSKCFLVCTNIVLTDTGISFPPHIKECFVSPTCATTIIPLSSVAETALYIDLSFEHKEYVCFLPNRHETD